MQIHNGSIILENNEVINEDWINLYPEYIVKGGDLANIMSDFSMYCNLHSYVILEKTLNKNEIADKNKNNNISYLYLFKNNWNSKIQFTIGLESLRIILGYQNINERLLLSLSDDEKLFITYLYLQKQFVIHGNMNNIEQLSLTLNAITKIIADQKENYKNLLKINEKDFISSYLDSIYTPMSSEYILLENFKKLNVNDELFKKNIFKIKNKEKYNNRYYYWFGNIMNLYPAEEWIKFGKKNKFFSFFKYFGYKLEEATGSNIPEKYNRKKIIKHPNKAGSISVVSAIEKEFNYIKNKLIYENIERSELLDWYTFIINNKLTNIFISTVECFPLNTQELNSKQMEIIKQKNNGIEWLALHFKIELESKLKNKTILKKHKI